MSAVILVGALILAFLFSVMALETVYAPKTTKGPKHSLASARTPSGRRSFRGEADKFVDFFGEQVLVRDIAGSSDIDATVGAGQTTVDLSSVLDSIRSAWVEPLGAGVGKAVWLPTTTDRLLEHGAVTGGPFQVGETITGGDSAATAVVVGVGSTFLQVKSVSGTFENGELITGGTSSATANLTHPTAAAGADPLQDKRRFVIFEFRDFTGTVIADTTTVTYTFHTIGDPLDN